MNTKEKRIKLALAMGWKHCQMRENLQRDCWEHPVRKSWFDESELPDPFTDANDDYLVLEWFRSQAEDAKAKGKPYPNELWEMSEQMNKGNRLTYQIGDYARAALKVIEK